MKPHGLRFWGAAAFIAHTLLVALVPLVERISTFTLRNLHELIVDRHAYELWWWSQTRYPHELGAVLSPLAKLCGLECASVIFWFAWYITIGALPYVIAAALIGKLRGSSTRRPLDARCPAPERQETGA